MAVCLNILILRTVKVQHFTASIRISHVVSGGTIVTSLFQESFKVGVFRRCDMIRILEEQERHMHT